MRTAILALTCALALSGCVAPQGRPTAATIPTPVKIISPPPVVSDGSLWQADARSDNSLTGDIKARNKGDIVTVLVVEKVNASHTRNTATNKNQATDASASQFFYPHIGTLNGVTPNLSYKSARTFTGGGTVTDSNTVSATVSTQVVEVLPNGNLVVSGSREVTLSGEVQTVTLTGIVREHDIQPDNTVPSTALAEARVHITGSGPLNDAQKRTQVARLLDWVNLF